MLRLFKRRARPRSLLNSLAEQRNIFIGTAGGRAHHHRNPIRAEALFGLDNLVFHLRQSVPQQLIIAAAKTFRQALGKRAQLLIHRAESQAFAGNKGVGDRERRGGGRLKQMVDMGA